MKYLIHLAFILLLVGCDPTPDVNRSSDKAVSMASGVGEARAAADKQPDRKIPWGKATRYGLFRERARGFVREDSKASTGKSIRRPTLEFAEDTQRIPLRTGVYFGYQYWLRLPPDEGKPVLKRVLIHPEMTLPDGSKVSRSERKFRKRATHGIVTAIDAYALSDDYELVEGDWVFQLWYQDKMLVEAKFTTYWSEEERVSDQGESVK
jgi:hypothetical protein